MLIGVAWSPSHQSETAHIGGTIMSLSYPELLNCYEDLKESVNRLVKELTRNGIVVNLNPQTIEVPDIHSSIFENKYYFDCYDVLLDFTDHDMKVINEYKNSKGDKKMEKSKIVETVQKLEEENRILREKLETLRTRCKESARDMFDNDMYGCLNIVRGKDSADCCLDFDSPLDFAKSLIEHRTHVEERGLGTDRAMILISENDKVTFDYDELEEIADYLLTYCKHNKEDL